MRKILLLCVAIFSSAPADASRLAAAPVPIPRNIFPSGIGRAPAPSLPPLSVSGRSASLTPAIAPYLPTALPSVVTPAAAAVTPIVEAQPAAPQTAALLSDANQALSDPAAAFDGSRAKADDFVSQAAPQSLGSMQEAADFIKTYRSFLVISHGRPDGDAVGATLGTVGLLQKLGKTAYAYNESSTPPYLRFIPNERNILHDTRKLPDFDAVIIVDCGAEKMYGSAIAPFIEGKPTLNLDHHDTNSDFGSAHWVEPSASAASELVTQLFEPFKIKPDHDVAMALFTGLFTDTGRFQHPSTNPGALEAAAALMRAGVKPSAVSAALQEYLQPEEVGMIASLVSAVEYNGNFSRADIVVPVDAYSRIKNMKAVVNKVFGQLRPIASLKVTVIYSHQRDGKWMAQLRGDGAIDVSKIAAQFGEGDDRGGGHRNAAACRSALPLETFKAKMRQAIDAALAKRR
jgi:phosphoesterase RecJ-like protein